MKKEDLIRFQKERYQLSEAENKKTEFFYKQNNTFLYRAFNKHLIPSIFISLGYTINTFFDGVIVGQKIGAEAFASINLCMPIFLFICVLGSLLGNGCYLLSSRAFGDNKKDEACEYYNTCIFYIIVTGIVITAFGISLCKPLCLILNGGTWNQNLYDYAIVTIASALPKMLLYVPLLYLRLDGKPGKAQFCSNIMTILNIILDIVFVGIFNWGTFGAAIASAIATLIAVVIGFVALHQSDVFHLSLHRKKDCLRDIFSFGSPAAMNNLMSAARILIINSAILRFGNVSDLCIFSVINNVSDLSLCIVDGIPQTATPIIAVYSAENSYKGIKIMMLRQVQYSILSTSIFGVLITVFANPIGKLFGYVAEDTQELTFAMLCLAISIVVLGILRIFIYFYNASGKNTLSNVITILRLFIVPVGFFLYFIYTKQIFWLFLPLSECVCLVLLCEFLVIQNGKYPDRTLFLQIPLKQTESVDSMEFSLHANSSEVCDAVEKMSSYLEEKGISPKITMRLSLAIEEMLTLLINECLKQNDKETFDIRVFYSKEKTGIRVRCMGKVFNPLDHSVDEDEKYMGVDMIKNIAKDTMYSSVLGVNNLVIII